MFYVRTVTTASKATAVQVVRYEQRKRIIVKHFGSAHTTAELQSLQQTARQWIEKSVHQMLLFPSPNKRESSLVPIDKLQHLGVRYSFARETITQLFHIFRFSQEDPLLLDLVLMRIVQPASKLASLELLSELFGIKHQRAELYRRFPTLVERKAKIEEKVLAVAKTHFAFDFTLVFYDVTTLYYEAFQEDGIRQPGFSKDNKSNQPQIVIGLLVTREGFPVAYDIHAGNTFEGKTFIPALCAFQKRHRVRTLTVVADAAMLSLDNIEKLVSKELSYIVGARIANLTKPQIRAISGQLGQVDQATMRLKTKRGTLICSFSRKRYEKEKREMEKQIAKANQILAGKHSDKRTKFLTYQGKQTPILNASLIEKTTLLLGIRGYYTNLIEETDETIICHYHNLWQVELAFRIAKSDLLMRPIYHYKKQTIEVHILLCFMALAVCKYMELKTNKSTRAVVKLLKQVTDVLLLNTLTNQEYILRSDLSPATQKVLHDLLPH